MTTTTPSLVVRIAQAWRPPVTALFVAAESWLVDQLAPPSVERANSTGSGVAPPRPLPRNPTLQTYALPKNGLDTALSTHRFSLSVNSAEFCLVTITGAIQA